MVFNRKKSSGKFFSGGGWVFLFFSPSILSNTLNSISVTYILLFRSMNARLPIRVSSRVTKGEHILHSIFKYYVLLISTDVSFRPF